VGGELATLRHCAWLSAACAANFAAGGGPARALHYMRACNKSAPQLAALRDCLSLLGAAAALPDQARAVFAAGDGGADCAAVLAAVALQFREHEVRLRGLPGMQAWCSYLAPCLSLCHQPGSHTLAPVLAR
jgi:hypothetical protein